MRKCVALAALLAQLMVGVCVLRANVSQAKPCAPCCEKATLTMSCACCRAGSQTLPSLEAPGPFKIHAPAAVAAADALPIAGFNLSLRRAGEFRGRAPDPSPPKVFLLHSALLI